MNLQIFIFLLVVVLIRLVEWDYFAAKQPTELASVAATEEAQTTNPSQSSQHLASIERTARRGDVVSLPVTNNGRIEQQKPPLMPFAQRVLGQGETERSHKEAALRVISKGADITITPTPKESQDADDARNPI